MQVNKLEHGEDSHRTQLKSTCDSGLEGAAGDVIRASILDADEIVAGGHGGVLHLVALRALLTIHLHLGWTLNGHRHGAWACFSVVDDELSLVT